MQQNKTLSLNADVAVRRYVDGKEGKGAANNNDAYFTLLVSLYAMQPNANQEVLSILHDYVDDLNGSLQPEELEVLRKEYRNVMEHCFSVAEESRFSPMGYIPNYIIEMGMKMAAPESNSDILLAHVGTWGLPYLSKGYNYSGYESSLEAWATAQIYIDVFDIHADIKSCPLGEFPNSFNKQYDYIYYSFKRSPFQDRESYAKREEELISLLEEHLRDNGHMFCFFPSRYTFGEEGKKFREALTDSPYKFEIEVIDYNRTRDRSERRMGGIQNCFMHIIKNHTGKITLVDATIDGLEGQFDFKDSSSLSHAERILGAIKEGDKRFIWRGMASELRENRDLNPYKYLKEEYLPTPEEGEKLMEIGELAEEIKCERLPVSNEDKRYPTIYVNDLSADYLKCDIQSDNLVDSSMRHFTFSVPCGDALLFGLSSTNSLVARLSTQNKKVGLGWGIIPLKLKKGKDIITEDFFLRALTLESTFKQARYSARGVIMHRLLPQDFLKLKIVVPNIEKQNEICQKESRARLSESDRKLLEEQETFRLYIRRQKHSIGQTMRTLKNWCDDLQAAREEGDGIVDEKTTYGKINIRTGARIFDGIKMAVKNLTEEIRDLGIAGDIMIPEDIDLTVFIEDYIKKNPNPLFEYEYECDKHHGGAEQLFDYDDSGNIIEIQENDTISEGKTLGHINFPRKALKEIFDNIISNACAHGFAGREKGNKVKIEIHDCGDCKYAITIANNGEPINSKLTDEDIFTYGRTSQSGSGHFGIGGFEVYKLMKEYNGEAQLISSPAEEFTVTYKLIFKNTTIN